MILPRDDVAVAIIGAGGLAQEVFAGASMFYKSFDPERVCFVVENGSPQAGQTVGEYSVIPESDVMSFAGKRGVDCYVAIGESPLRRRAVAGIEKALQDKIQFPQLITPGSSIIGQVLFGRGVTVMPGCVLTIGIRIGEFTYINIGAMIGHNATLGEYCSVNPGSIISGDVVIGSNVYLGSGVIVLQGISICDDVIIGAGAVVVRPITEPGVYVGTPAQKVKGHPSNRIVKPSIVCAN